MSARSRHQLKNRVRRVFDRPGGRALLGLLMTARIWQKHRVFARVTWHDDGYWVFRYPEAAIPKPKLLADRLPPRAMEEEASGIFFQEYMPGPGDIVIDVGAELGSEINLLSRLVGPEGHVYAIEAHPTTFQWLARRRDASGLTNVTPVNVAISDHAGTAWISDEADSLESRLTGDRTGHPVRALTLDDFMHKHSIDHVDFLKINIEGAERLAIQGMKNCASRIAHVAVGCHDFLADRLDDDWFRTKEVVRQSLLALGFEIVERRSDDRRDWARGWLYAFPRAQDARRSN
jgi:FkbM family methyltransferase